MGPRSPDPRSAAGVCACVRARVCCHWRVDFLSKRLSPPAVPGTRRGLERFGGPVKLALLGAWGRGTWPRRPPHWAPTSGGKSEASKSFLPGSASSALPRALSGQPGQLRYQHGVSSQREARAKATPFRLPGPEPPRDRRGQAARGPAGGGPASPRPRQHTGRSADAGCPSARPRSGGPGKRRRRREGARRLATPPPALAPAPARRAATSHPSSPPAGRARRGRAPGPGAAPRPPPPPSRRPGFSSGPLSPATFRALFSGWK